MPSVPTPPAVTKAGIITSDTGDRHIPSSVRPDGTKRREIKIRPGYKPPEDVEVYKNRTADAWKTRGSSGVPGAEGLKDDDKPESSSSSKNAKRREARKKAKAAEEGTTSSTDGKPEDKKSDVNGENWREGKVEEKNEEEEDAEAEKEKKARNLKKKLKQAKELKEKKEGGGALLPEQFAKVIKISELIRELDALGFDAEGEKKVVEETREDEKST